MKTRLSRTALLLIATTLAATGWAAGEQARIRQRLEGDPWQTVRQLSAAVTLCGGQVTVSIADLHHRRDPQRSVTTLEVVATTLAPRESFMLLVNGAPLRSFATDGAGAAKVRLATGHELEGWETLPESLGSLQPPITAQVIAVARGENATALLGPSAGGVGLPDGAYFNWTPLCGASGTRLKGEASVLHDEKVQLVFVAASGLLPGESYQILANGLQLGAAVADSWGYLSLEASSDPGRPGSVPLPEALKPVEGVDAVAIAAGSEAVLSGSFSNPCQPIFPTPVAWGNTTLCATSADSLAMGSFDYVIYDDGLQEATLYGRTLPPGQSVTVTLNGVAVTTASVDEFGSLWLYFSSANGAGGLPLPPEVLPLDHVDEVAVSAGGEAILRGSASHPCDPGYPYNPIASARTGLCPEAADLAAGQVAWLLFSNAEELVVNAFGLPAAQAVTLVVDGSSYGTYQTDEFGSLILDFSTLPIAEWGQLPLPEGLSPVSEIDRVSLMSGDSGALVSGSFSSPCVEDVPEPVEWGSILLCLAESSGGDPRQQKGGAFDWVAFSDGHEEAFLSASGLPPSVIVEVSLDGSVVATKAADEWGYLWLSFSSKAIADAILLPSELLPLRELDVVKLSTDGTTILSGSASNPCDPWAGWEFRGAATGLCPSEGKAAGYAGWWQSLYQGGVVEEGVEVAAWGLAGGATYQVVIDDSVVASIEADPAGWFRLLLGAKGEPIPELLQPLAEIDRVVVLDGAGNIVLAGSFANPCSELPIRAGGASAVTPVTSRRPPPVAAVCSRFRTTTVAAQPSASSRRTGGAQNSQPD
ncbi:MAG: hypothetical protein V1750_07385 [Acidobacteriota bacterium]